MKIVTKIVFMILSDMYRAFVYIKEIMFDNSHSFDVAYITNFQNDIERGFLGLSSLWKYKPFELALKLRMNNITGRFIAINNIADNMVKDLTTGQISDAMKTAKKQVRQAITYSVNRGAKVILFGASTKRLFSREEISILLQQYPNIIFTIGDNGTAWSLWQDILSALKEFKICKHDKIAVIGPNGFLGSVAKKKLMYAKYKNIIQISQKDETPFDNLDDVKLVIACSHHKKVRLTASIIHKIAHANGIHIIDVCKPHNFSYCEYLKCKDFDMNVTRQDSGNTLNDTISYDGILIAGIALKQLELSPKRMFGCFSEATALAAFSHHELLQYDFFNVSDAKINFINDAFKRSGFYVSSKFNFGNMV